MIIFYFDVLEAGEGEVLEELAAETASPDDKNSCFCEGVGHLLAGLKARLTVSLTRPKTKCWIAT
jgi:hypothetical protein